MNKPIALSSPSQTVSANPVVSSKKNRWPLYLSGGVLALGVMGFGAAGGAYASWHSGKLIAPGVAIAGVDVGGLSTIQARAQLQKHFGEMPLKLTVGDQNFETTLAKLGGTPSLDLAVAKAAKIGRQGGAVDNFVRVYGSKTAGERLMLPILWDKTKLVSELRKWDENYATKAADASLKVDENGVRIVPETLGRRLNIGATAQAIQGKYFVGTHAIKAYSRAATPKISAADLQGRDVLLASYPTRFDSGLAGRTTNLHVACAAINGHVMMPGDTFSFNQMTGERTWDKGYRMGHIFETKPGADKAEVVDGLAGGVCQVSSTLFNAVRRSNAEMGSKGLKIVERNTHSLPVSYVPSGLDATVAWPGKDFRFRNALDHPVFLRADIRRSKLTIGIWERVPEGEIVSDSPSSAADSSE